MGHQAQNGVKGKFDASRLDGLEERLDRLAVLLETMFPPHLETPPETAVASPPERKAEIIRPTSFPKARARVARESIRRRRKRDEYFPAGLFADPGWDIMLDLYAAHYEGVAVSVSSLCIAAAVPQTTALRWITTMTNDGWLIRWEDPADGRRTYVRLSDRARSRLDAFFDDLPY